MKVVTATLRFGRLMTVAVVLAATALLRAVSDAPPPGTMVGLESYHILREGRDRQIQPQVRPTPDRIAVFDEDCTPGLSIRYMPRPCSPCTGNLAVAGEHPQWQSLSIQAIIAGDRWVLEP